RRLGPLARRLMGQVHLFAVQTQDYAACYRALGAAAERVHVTGSVKFDGVEADPHNPRTEDLRRLLGIGPEDLVWVAGSTQAPEEAIVLNIFRRLRHEHPNLHLLLVPRQRERFDEVAALLGRSGLPVLRRSTLPGAVPDPRAVILVDTIGE